MHQPSLTAGPHDNNDFVIFYLLFDMRQLKIATQITNRDSQAVEKYLQEISKIPMITPEEETVLAQRIKMGDQKALDKLVQANLRFVVSVAKQYQHQGFSLSDLDQRGQPRLD